MLRGGASALGPLSLGHQFYSQTAFWRNSSPFQDIISYEIMCKKKSQVQEIRPLLPQIPAASLLISGSEGLRGDFKKLHIT